MQIIYALRVRQWSKNILIFCPALAFGGYDIALILDLMITFIGFSLVVSSTYIVNDLIDIESDKVHPKKKFRPIAAGYFTEKIWIKIALSIFLIGNITLLSINGVLIIFSLIYCVVTIAYSTVFKFKKFFDLFTISTLFLLRILVGAIPFNINITIELFIFVFFTSTGIVSSKKYSILKDTRIDNTKIKNFLASQYVGKELLQLVNFSFFISLMTYTIWIFNNKFGSVENSSLIFLVLSLGFLTYFKYLFVKETYRNTTEDIFHTVLKNKNLLISIGMFSLFSIIGLL